MRTVVGEQKISEGPSAAERWRRMMRARDRSMRRFREGVEADPARERRGWRRYAAAVPAGAERGAFYKHVRRFVGSRTVVLDVGAGPGTHAIPLARVAGSVIAVDPSKYLLGVLERTARRERLTNITRVLSRWEEADEVEADISISSYVLYWVPDAASFFEKMDKCTGRRAFLYTDAGGFETPLWRHFHESEPAPFPSYLDAVAVLKEMGVAPEIKVIDAKSGARRYPFRSLAVAVNRHVDWLMLPNTPEIRRELREILSTWLVRKDGMLGPPHSPGPSAIISWVPKSAL